MTENGAGLLRNHARNFEVGAFTRGDREACPAVTCARLNAEAIVLKLIAFGRGWLGNLELKMQAYKLMSGYAKRKQLRTLVSVIS